MFVRSATGTRVKGANAPGLNLVPMPSPRPSSRRLQRLVVTPCTAEPSGSITRFTDGWGRISVR